MAKLKQTPSQTVGPYFAYGLTAPQYSYPHTAVADARLARPDADGERIRVEGRVLDGEGNSIGDALIEIWQADGRGRYVGASAMAGANSGFTGFGRVGTGTDPDNRFVFDTVKPGRIDAAQAPHINVIVQMRGLLTHLFTRIYFSDEEAGNAADPVLALVPAERRGTLIACRTSDAMGTVYRFDIHMQGAAETVFFDV
jgi:protocatechuate 3,4-dioxygenase alpha subunit